MAERGAQAALRGYRLQALYTLHRAFTGDPKWRYRLEGHEDLDIVDHDGVPIEHVQVKAVAAPITPSDFQPRQPESFFRRVLQRRGAAKEVLATYGQLGDQFAQALAGPGIAREDVTKYLEQSGYAAGDADYLFQALQIEFLDETTLQETVFRFIGETLTGCDPEAAFGLLMNWLFQTAERRGAIAQTDLRDRIVAVGKFIHERAAHHVEWFRSIAPLAAAGTLLAKDVLKDEFYAGAAARYDHVAAGVDIERLGHLDNIEHGFATYRVVVVRGASGQGKSALAYRYLLDYIPASWRFEIRLLDGKQHALNVARALMGHLDAVGNLAFVYLDVRPGTEGWTDLVRELLPLANCRLLITIREEDWRRSRVAEMAGAFHEVKLELDRAEAKQLYGALVAVRTPSHVLSFDDAWSRFESAGPLLEFVHLVTANKTLRERLNEQLQRLRDEIRRKELFFPEDLDLLRSVAVASAYGASLDIKRVAAALRLPDIGRTLQLLEGEYLLRMSSDRTRIEGLHPIRSDIITDLLTADDIDWLSAAEATLPLLPEDDLEGFLLHAFSRHSDQLARLIAAVQGLTTQSWSGCAGVLRALLWVVVHQYVAQNEPVIRAAYKENPGGWQCLVARDVGRLDRIEPDMSFDRIFGSAFKSFPGAAVARKRWRDRMSPPASVFEPALTWLHAAKWPMTLPATVPEWEGFADVAFWTQHLEVSADLLPHHATPDAVRRVATLPLSTASRILYSLHAQWRDRALAQFTESTAALLERFRSEAETPVLEDDGVTVVAHFIVPIDDSGTQDDEEQIGPQTDPHGEAIRRTTLLQGVVPDREVFGTQGYGHRRLFPQPYDETEKRIPWRNALPDWPVELNARFFRLAEYLFRQGDWTTYVESCVGWRDRATQSLELLLSNLQRVARDKHPFAAAEQVAEGMSRFVEFNDPLPRTAVDEWGFVSESRDSTAGPRRRRVGQPGDEKDSERGRQVGVALLGLHQLLKSQKEWTSQLGFFARHVCRVAAALLVSEPNAIDEESQRFAHLSRHCLCDAYLALPQYQVEFRKHFIHIAGDVRLRKLELAESQAVERAMALWHFMSMQWDRRPLRDSLPLAVKWYDHLHINWRRRLQLQLESFSNEQIQVSTSLAQEPIGANYLLIRVNLRTAVTWTDALAAVYVKIVEVLEPIQVTSADYNAIRTNLSKIRVIVLMRNRLLHRMWLDWSVTLLVGQSIEEPPPAWRFFFQPIAPDIWPTLRLSEWSDHRAEAAARLARSVARLYGFVCHAADVAEIHQHPSADPAVVSAYIVGLSPRLSTELQNTIDAIGQVAEYLGAKIDIDSGVLPHPTIIALVEALQELRTLVLPSAEFDKRATVPLEECAEWSTRLAEAARQSEAIGLVWSGYILDGEPRGLKI